LASLSNFASYKNKKVKNSLSQGKMYKSGIWTCLAEQDMRASFKGKCPALMRVDGQCRSVLIVAHAARRGLLLLLLLLLLTLFPGPGYDVHQTREQVIDLRQKLKTTERGVTQNKGP
jgi:hypothetical protein